MSTNLAQLLTLPSLDQVRALTSDDFDAMNTLIKRELRSDVPLVREITGYIVQSGGKRLRPLIVLLVARMCSYKGTDHIKLATLVEFLHTATLLHDDVVDKSTRRRNRRSANAHFLGQLSKCTSGRLPLLSSIRIDGRNQLHEFNEDHQRSYKCHSGR